MYLFFKTINKVQPLKIEDKNNLKINTLGWIKRFGKVKSFKANITMHN